MTEPRRHEINARMARLRTLTALDKLDAALEAELRAIIADPGPLAANGQIIRDSDGEPLQDERVRREAERVLREHRGRQTP